MRFYDNRLWVPLRAWVNLLNEHFGMKIKLKYDEQLGYIDVWIEEQRRTDVWEEQDVWKEEPMD